MAEKEKKERQFWAKIGHFAAKIGRFLAKTPRFLAKILPFLDDLLCLAGLAVIVRTTFVVSEIAGWYLLGVTLVLAGVLVANTGRRVGRK